jgi:GTP-binding protein
MAHYTRVISRCSIQLPISARLVLRSYSSSTLPEDADFEDVAADIRRRKRKADSKRRQHGASFVDHTVITVRGGEQLFVL